MTGVVRVPLVGGGSVLVEADPRQAGPVKAGRIDEVVEELPENLEASLGPVVDTARAVVSRLRELRPGVVELQFGVDLALRAGAVITRGEAACHLRVTVTWENEDADAD